jgi:hypothetical protein
MKMVEFDLNGNHVDEEIRIHYLKKPMGADKIFRVYEQSGKFPRLYFKHNYAMLPIAVVDSLDNRYHIRRSVTVGNKERVLDTIFKAMNSDFSNPLATEPMQAMLQERGIGHTSMSVRDVVYLDGNYYICGNIGWRKIFLE